MKVSASLAAQLSIGWSWSHTQAEEARGQELLHQGGRFLWELSLRHLLVQVLAPRLGIQGLAQSTSQLPFLLVPDILRQPRPPCPQFLILSWSPCILWRPAPVMPSLGRAPRAVFVHRLFVGVRISAMLSAICMTLSPHHRAGTKLFSKHPAISHSSKDPK